MSRRFLVDTHCWLWWHIQPEKLSSQAHAALEDGSHEILCSVVSAWEICIKQALGKLRLPLEPEIYIPGRLQASRMTTLPVLLEHAMRVTRLPRHHRDPFDRLLVAQAQVEDVTLITADEQLQRYDVTILMAV